MKAIFFMIVFLFSSYVSCYAELVQIEELTEVERVALATQTQAIKEQQEKLKILKRKILKAHNINEEEHMEWKKWVVFEGDFILVYYSNFMDNREVTFK